jgi:hypothetical protein
MRIKMTPEDEFCLLLARGQLLPKAAGCTFAAGPPVREGLP